MDEFLRRISCWYRLGLPSSPLGFRCTIALSLRSNGGVSGSGPPPAFSIPLRRLGVRAAPSDGWLSELRRAPVATRFF